MRVSPSLPEVTFPRRSGALRPVCCALFPALCEPPGDTELLPEALSAQHTGTATVEGGRREEEEEEERRGGGGGGEREFAA